MRQILFLLAILISNYCYSQLTEAYIESSNEPSANGWGFGLTELQSAITQWSDNENITIDTIGFTVEGRPMYRVTVAKNRTISNQKYRIAIHARTHAAEVQSTYVTNEMLYILMSGSELANRLLDSCVFNIIPMYNVDGVELGLARTNVNGVDIEGDWSLENPEKEVATLRALYKSYMDSELPVRIALNMHSAIACQRYFVCHDAVGTSNAFLSEEKKFINGIRNYWPDGIQSWNYNITWTTSTPKVYPESFFWNNYKEKVMALTYEDMNCETAGEYDKTASAILNGVSDYLGLSTWTGSDLEVKSVAQNEVTIYPNPVMSGSTIYLKMNGNNPIYSSLILNNIEGKTILNQKINFEKGESSFRIPSNLKGIYFLTIQGNKGNETIKLVIN